jgi:hypothetical protein
MNGPITPEKAGFRVASGTEAASALLIALRVRSWSVKGDVDQTARGSDLEKKVDEAGDLRDQILLMSADKAHRIVENAVEIDGEMVNTRAGMANGHRGRLKNLAD